MCGIFGVVNDKTNNAAQTSLDCLKKLEYRGYDSWGIAIKPLTGNLLMCNKQAGKISQAKTNLPASFIAIGHTRWATHGDVTDKNAHPHFDCHKKIAVIHNGIFENYAEFKEKLKKKYHRFVSETDTEVIAHLIEEKLKTKPIIQSVFETFNQLAGNNAIAILDLISESIIACRDGSPLVVGIDHKNQQYFLASDVTAFLKYTNKVYFLNDGEGVVINKTGITLFDLKSIKKKKLSIKNVDWKLEEVEKGDYPHFLLKEIFEQRKTISKAVTTAEKKFKEINFLIRKGYKVILTGCGTAYYCALAGKYFFAQAGIESHCYGAYEFLPFARFCDKRTLLITISQSGETADTLIAAKKAKKQGARIVAVVNTLGSTLERLADFTLPVNAGPEIAVVSTKAFTSQLAILYLLAQTTLGKYQKAKKEIDNLQKMIKEWLNQKLTKKIIKLAKLLVNKEHLYVLGKHLNYPAALEFALKIKETSYLHSEAFSAGELKHGVITLIEKNTPCFVLASNDEIKREVLSSAAEMKARGGYIIGVAPFNAPEFDDLIKTPDLGNLTIFPNVIVGQLLGYYLGVSREVDPDKPRNLAKSVTVK